MASLLCTATLTPRPTRMPQPNQRHTHADTIFERHFSVADLAQQWRLGRETVRLLAKDEPGVLKIRPGRRKAMTRHSIPESVARRVHTKLFHTVALGRQTRRSRSTRTICSLPLGALSARPWAMVGNA